MTKSETDIKDTVTKRNKYLWILFLSFGGLVYITSYCFPEVVLTYNKTMDTCPTKIFEHLGYDCADFNNKNEHFMAFEVDSFGPENIQGHLRYLLLYKDDYEPIPNQFNAPDIHFQIQENVYVVDDAGNILSIIREKNSNDRRYFCDVEKRSTGPCPVHIATDLTPKISGKIILVIKLEKAYDLYQNHIQEVRLAFQTYNPSFLKFIRSFKWILFLIAIGGFASYKNSMSLLPKEFSSFENRLVTLLGLSLILFNQPFLSYTNTLSWKVDLSYQVKACASIVIMQLESFFVLYLWFYLLQKLSSNSQTVSIEKKIITAFILLLHGAASFYPYYVFTRHQCENGMADPDTDMKLLAQICRAYLYFAAAVFTAYSALKLVRIFPQLKHLDWRQGTAFTFSFCFAACYIYFIGTANFQTLNLKGPRIALLYGATTLYTVLLQLVYKPFDFEIEETKQKYKYDNPRTKSQYQNLEESVDESDAREMDNMTT